MAVSVNEDVTGLERERETGIIVSDVRDYQTLRSLWIQLPEWMNFIAFSSWRGGGGSGEGKEAGREWEKWRRRERRKKGRKRDGGDFL